MALLPAAPSRKLKLFAVARPNYSDYNGPPDGDYVRYVEGLVAWSEQEQERQRLKALGAKGHVPASAPPDSEWGHAPSKSAAAASVTTNVYTQPGGVETAVDRLKRKAQAQAVKLQQQANSSPKTQTTAAGTTQKPQKKTVAQSSWLLFIGALIAVAIFASDWLPIAIVAFAAINLVRAVRKASRAGRS